MKLQHICWIVSAGLLVGCAGTGNRTGMGAAFNDSDVLTGGPVMGTKLNDLPDAVRQTLQERYPRYEVSDIDRVERLGEIVYLVKFVRTGGVVSLAHDGKILYEDSQSVGGTQEFRQQQRGSDAKQPNVNNP